MNAIVQMAYDKESSVRPVLDLLERSRNTNATDPRDKVLAMLAFGSDLDGPLGQFAPNYSASARFVYTDFALWHIGTNHSLDVLGYCSARDRELSETNVRQGRITTSIGVQPSVQSAVIPYSPALDMPSWVPNWSHRVSHAVLPKYQQSENTTLPPLFHASGHHGPAFHAPNKERGNISVLVAQGVRLAGVVEVAYTQPSETLEITIDESWQPIRFDGICPLTGLTRSIVFRRTI